MDWREKVRSSIDEYVEVKSTLSSALHEALSELKVSPYGIGVSSELVERKPLTWKVTMNLLHIGKIHFNISINDILDGRDESGFPTREIPKDPVEAFRKCIVEKVARELEV